MTANQNADNMLLQVDSEVKHFLLVKEINDHCKDDYSINKTNGLLTSNSGNLHEKKTNREWIFQGECKDRCLSVGPASETPKLLQYRVVLFHTPDNGLIDL